MRERDVDYGNFSYRMLKHIYIYIYKPVAEILKR